MKTADHNQTVGRQGAESMDRSERIENKLDDTLDRMSKVETAFGKLEKGFENFVGLLERIEMDGKRDLESLRKGFNDHETRLRDLEAGQNNQSTLNVVQGKFVQFIMAPLLVLTLLGLAANFFASRASVKEYVYVAAAAAPVAAVVPVQPQSAITSSPTFNFPPAAPSQKQ